MKVALPKQPLMMTKEPLLPLVPDLSGDVLDKSNSSVYECRTDPADDTLPKYKMTVRIINGSENVRTLLKW